MKRGALNGVFDALLLVLLVVLSGAVAGAGLGLIGTVAWRVFQWIN